MGRGEQSKITSLFRRGREQFSASAAVERFLDQGEWKSEEVRFFNEERANAMWDALLERIGETPPSASEKKLAYDLSSNFASRLTLADQMTKSPSELWAAAVNEVQADGEFQKNLLASGLGATYIAACVKQYPVYGPRIFNKFEKSVVRDFLEMRVSAKDVNADLVDEIRLSLTKERVEQRMQEIENFFPKAKQVLTSKESSGEDKSHALSTVLGALSKNHLTPDSYQRSTPPPIEGLVVSWPAIREDWQAFKRALREQAEGIPVQLQTPFDSRNNSIFIVCRALEIDDPNVVAGAIEQIANEVTID